MPILGSSSIFVKPHGQRAKHRVFRSLFFLLLNVTKDAQVTVNCCAIYPVTLIIVRAGGARKEMLRKRREATVRCALETVNASGCQRIVSRNVRFNVPRCRSVKETVNSLRLRLQNLERPLRDLKKWR